MLHAKLMSLTSTCLGQAVLMRHCTYFRAPGDVQLLRIHCLCCKLLAMLFQVPCQHLSCPFTCMLARLLTSSSEPRALPGSGSNGPIILRHSGHSGHSRHSGPYPLSSPVSRGQSHEHALPLLSQVSSVVCMPFAACLDNWSAKDLHWEGAA